MPDLGKVEYVGIREIWPNEASDFTPWLADNIAELGTALGLDLELQQREAAVGSYSLDILATDSNGSRPVVIENQLGITDHDHLGKLLTYATGYDANVIVWLTSEFRDEHRAALDWLNQRTTEETEFFGIVVELLTIDGSLPAVNFKPVSTPNKWSIGTTRTGTTGIRETSERGERYQAFFQGLIDSLRMEHNFTKARKGGARAQYSFSAGHGQRAKYNVSFAGNGRARTEVYIDNTNRDWNKRLFDRLMEKKGSIESELSESLEWQRLDHRRACRISAVREGSIDDDSETLEEIHNWMIEKLLDFKKVFGPRLDELVQQT